MAIQILMPALSPTMEEGKLAQWLVKEGDAVNAGDVIAEIETDKAVMEVEAVDEGVLGKILVPDGSEQVAVNQPIAILLEEGENASTLDAISPASAPKSEAMPQEISKMPAKNSSLTCAEAPALPEASHKAGTRIFASPLARRLAQQNNLDISQITGTGPHGRIVQRDILTALERGSQKIPVQTSAQIFPTAAAPQDEMSLPFPEDSYEQIPHSSMRKVIATRLLEAKQTIPHFYLTIDCEIDALLALRAEINASATVNSEGKPHYKISVNDMIIKAHALALRDVPDANVSWTENAMLRHKSCDIGVAVAIPDGLMTPIIRSAEQKTLSIIATEMSDLAARARKRKLAPEEYQGGSSAISNLGMFGIREFSAVINPPHATILAIGAGEQRPVAKEGTMQVATIMTVTLSSDHRAVDGALGAQLLAAFKGYIENPMRLLV